MANSKKRKSQPGAPGKGRYLSKSSKKQKKSLDLYEASDSDPDEEKHAERYDKVDNYEYELPSDFEDEEIDEDLAFTEEDKKKYAGWFGEEAADAQIDRQQNKRHRGEFAEPDSSSQEEADEEEDHDIEVDGGEEDAHGYGSDEEYQQEQQQQQHANGLADSVSDDDLQDALAGSGSSSSGDDDYGGEPGNPDDGTDELDEDRHRAMLAAALGKQLQQRDDGGGGAVRRGVSAAARNAAVIAEAYPESEAHAATTAAGGELRLSDLLGGLSGSSGGAGLGGARKLLEKLDKRAAPVTAPLPRTVADRLERKAGYDDTKQEVTKWQPIVKANREAPTIRFTSARHEVSAAAASTAALVDGFTPDRSDPDGLEAQVAALLGAAGNAAAAAMEEAEQALTEKAYTSDEAAARAAKLSRMRHLMFYAELKAKRLARIKSKEHHRRANRAAKRAAARAAEAAGDQQAEARAAEEEAEFERAKERLTLKHKNSSKWARRALKRGAAVVDVSTREALAAQLALGQQLRRKIEGTRGDSSGSQEDESTSASEPEDADAAAANTTGRLMSSRNRKEALAILKGLSDPSAAAGGGLAGDEDSSSKRKGLFALPFMVRALEKQRAAAAQEAAALLADMETGTAAAAAAGVGGGTAADEFVAAAAADVDSSGAAGRMTFGGSAGAAAAARAAAVDALEAGSGSDDEEDVEAKAQRLGRHIAGDTAAATAAAVGVSVKAAVSRTQQTQLDSSSSKAGQQQQQQNAADVGTVEVELPSQGAGACAEVTPVRSAAGAAAAATNSSAHADLFVSGKAARRKQQQQQQQQSDVAGCKHPSSAAFIPCATWQGPREGYTFKLDKAGLGYHRDSNATQQANTKQPSKAHRQQQQAAAVQPLLQLQQQHMEAASGDSDDEVARQQQQQQQQQQNGVNGSRKGIRGPAAAAAVHAMQLLSDEGDLQRQLLSAAFAGDDVEADFAADKSAEVEAELPPDQTEGQMPGWGTWKTQQREPAWMAAAKANAAAQRAAATASRKDAQLKNVVISEKWDKKSAKYLANTLPFPFRDKDVYETAIRQPLGRQYNPDAAFRNLTRPAVLKDAGVVIQPLRHSKHVEQYNSGAAGKGRAVVTVAGGMQLQGQAAGTGAGGVGKGAGKKGQGSKHQKGRAAGRKTGSSKRGRLHDAAQ